jgi:hypothetical protein
MGPSCWEVDKIVELIDAGMNIARLNFSHGDHEGHGACIARIREAQKLRPDNLKRSYSKNWKPNVPDHQMSISLDSHKFPHPIWDLESAENVQVTHFKPTTVRDKIAYCMMRILRNSYDLLSGYKPGKMNESLYVRRCIFLETFAGVPGFIGGMMRHLNSLRSLRIDGGWIHHLLEEAENERQHLFTFLSIRQPGMFMRLLIMSGQFFFIAGYTFMYLLSPTTAHRFVGYLEEEAVRTYTQILKDLDDGKLPQWEDMNAPQESIKYWGLPYDAKFRDVILSIRADECAHREFNHHFADIPKDSIIGHHKLNVKNELKNDKIKF